MVMFVLFSVIVHLAVTVAAGPLIRHLHDVVESLEKRVNKLERDRNERLDQTAQLLRQLADVLSYGKTANQFSYLWCHAVPAL